TAERQPTPTPPPLQEFAEQLAPTFTAGDREAVRQHSQSRPETVLQTVHAQVPSRSERHGNGLADVAADPLTSSPHKPDQRASLPPVAIARPSAVGASQGDRASNGLRSTAQRTASETVPELSSKLAATADVRDDTVTRVVEAEAPAKARAQHMELGLRVLAQETHFDPEPPKPVRILSEKISSALRGMSDEQFATRSLGASGQVPSNDATSDTLRILSIQLEPERLGAVRARIELKGNMVQIELAANNQDAKAIIQKDSDALVNMLRSAGYVVSEETIRVIDLPRNEQLNSILQQTTTSDADTSSDGSDRAAGDRNHRDRTGSQRDDRADDDARGQPENEAPSSGRRGLYV
ncbi:MAG: flagellar hook-length control protein FliK, partial [Hyphomicrobiaceae bacterium]